MINLFRAMQSYGKDVFSWVVLDETCLDVSPRGNFDLIEHAHFISGPSASDPCPSVTNVFTYDEHAEGLGEFGIGHDLPDIDSLL
jgi:hypothetical protein